MSNGCWPSFIGSTSIIGWRLRAERPEKESEFLVSLLGGGQETGHYGGLVVIGTAAGEQPARRRLQVIDAELAVGEVEDVPRGQVGRHPGSVGLEG